MWSECDNDCCSSAHSMGGGGDMRIAFNYAFFPSSLFYLWYFFRIRIFFFFLYSTRPAADAVLLLVGYQANREHEICRASGNCLWFGERKKLGCKMKGEAILTFNCRAECQCQLVFGIFVSPSLSPGCLRLTMCSQWCTHHKYERHDQIDAFPLPLCLTLALAENFAGRIWRPTFFLLCSPSMAYVFFLLSFRPSLPPTETLRKHSKANLFR